MNYLRVAMADQFNVTATNQGVWSDAASANTYPYAVVQAPSENYDLSSNDPETGFKNFVIADGMLNILIYANDSALAYSLSRQMVIAMDFNQSSGQLDSDMGTITDVIPIGNAAMPPVDESGTLGPVVYRRFLTFGYKQEFYL